MLTLDESNALRCAVNGLAIETPDDSEIVVFSFPPPYVFFFESNRMTSKQPDNMVRVGGERKLQVITNEYPLEPKCIS